MRAIVGSVALAVGAANALAASALGFLFEATWLILGPASLATVPAVSAGWTVPAKTRRMLTRRGRAGGGSKEGPSLSTRA
jgi:hypothetical protein